MSDFRRLADLFRLTLDALASSREPEAVRVASDTLALVESRIIETGKDADGGRFPGYSQKKVAASNYAGKSRNAGAAERVKRAKNLSYAEFRQLNNLQTGHVDLYFTGEMWRGTGVIVEKRLLRSTLVRIGGRTPESARKIDLNSARYGGSILEPSDAELAQVKAAWAAARASRLRLIFR